jgi:diguanylate cyclase
MSCVDGECGEDGGMDTDESREAALRDEIARLRDALGQARRDAVVDALTGCLNRRGWAKSIEVEERRCRRHELDAAVVMVDLDGLKAINDERGHAAGDQQLITCARALRSVVRGEDLVARLGGDEFAVLAVQTISEAPHAIVAHIERAFDAAGVRASLGWALRSSHTDLIAAITAADHGMLAMKRHRGREASPVDRGR